jgi:hypothetical protein
MNGKIILIGGLDTKTKQCSKSVFIGCLSRERNNIKWEKVADLAVGRWSHLTFKMKYFINVVGGCTGNDLLASCEMYDLRTSKWSQSKHKLPFLLFRAAVEVDPDENFAIILGGELSINEYEQSVCQSEENYREL